MIADFRQQLAAAYEAWDASKGTTPAQFFALMDEVIEFRTVLEGTCPGDPLAGPFLGKAAVLGYWSAIAESWELISSRTDALVAEGNTVVWTGQVRWRNRRNLRVFTTPKVDVWTVFQGRAIRYFELVDSAGYLAAIADPVPADAG